MLLPLNFFSFFSESLHYFTLFCKKSTTKLDRAALIFSIDVDVGSGKLGEKNEGKIDHNINDRLPESVVGKIEEQAFPILLQAFDDLEVPATFAIRGQLTEVDNFIFDLLFDSSTKHDIGAHGYSHREFTSLRISEADKELEMISNQMKKLAIIPKSFIFPKNKIAHLPLLEKWGYLCYRGKGDFLRDTMNVRKIGNLYNIQPSLFIGWSSSVFFLKRIVNIAIEHRTPLHLWCHPWNFGNKPEAARKYMNNVLTPLLIYAKKKQKVGVLEFETMRSTAEKLSMLEKS